MWNIHVLENTLRFTAACAEELNASKFATYIVERKIAIPADIASHQFKLEFDPDDMEHMDYLEYTELQDILTKHNAAGKVCFGSFEGDNQGEFWGYLFSAYEYSMNEITGRIVWELKTDGY